MKNRIMLITLLTLFGLPATTHASLNVFACEPEWSALAEEIGGKLVEVTSATHALQDPHYVEARPSLISRVRKADLVICSGAQLEIGWLPMLLSKANNRDVLPGQAGFLEASSFVPRLDVPQSVDRAQGDMHPQGNPHVQMNPHNIALVARALGARMALLDAANSAVYAKGTDEFLLRWQSAIVDWEKRAKPLAGKRVVCHHKSWVYLEDWLQLQEVATLEPVPGIPPTASHLSSLLSELGTDGSGADVIIRSPFQSAKASDWLQEQTGIPAVMLPLTVGGTDGASDLFGLFDDVLNRLLALTGGAGG
ncbi:MAG: zinc ABC transporter solute-binding protein [Xanthomonadales bacterium]|nr:zinc ABC transporter substrate-binding protein [Gammaproteobacteria bacterium]MBT8053370.1 zinc ABC transporter substrate-binding protein [Gammaproteobacteria bacterium]NND55641.1 zinc ABC transporter solute-binding protein [Xanthomonadales bacterium]NNK50490.1 zinc ABC transporter solute-binding protein [Xanthomonadales bacterium]